MSEEKIETVAMETYARRSFNYLNNMVDKDGLPYFNIFWAEPSEAAHDWPDFGDVMSRQLQAVVMARHMTGQALPMEKVWLEKSLSLVDPGTGFLYRPKTNFSEHVADMGDAALTLYAYVTAYADSKDSNLKKIICKMTDSLLKKYEGNLSEGAGFLSGFTIKSLMACARFLDYEPALKLAGMLVDKVFNVEPLFSPDNTFRHGGHMHGNLRTLSGAADWAIYTKDPVIFSRVDAIYRYVRTTATSFGFLPEVIGRQCDIIACETCAVMDYLSTVVTLANHGHPEYWSDAEKIARNYMIENQATDCSWLKPDNSKEDSPQFSWRDVDKRMIGGYAGWSSPNHILATRESLNAQWDTPETHDKTRAFQNCCGGSGTHAFFIIWKNASRFDNGTLSVNMHIDKLLPQAEIRGFQPYKGLLTISLKESCNVRVRIPEFVKPNEMRAESDKGKIEPRQWGNYLELGKRNAGENLKITYPLPVYTEEFLIGNPGFKQYKYRAAWKGDTVVKMEPLGNDYKTGYSDFDKKEVPVFYGKEGPGPLYQRDHMLKDAQPEPSELYMDTSPLDFWFIKD